MIIEQNTQALEQMVMGVMNSHFSGRYRITSSTINFPCPVCGDSKNNPRKRRCYILKKKIPWVTYCQNCNYSSTTSKFLKDYYPSFYKDYVKELLKGNKQPEVPKEEPKKFYNERRDIEFFTPILEGSGKLFEDALKLCRDRMIPKDIYESWFVSTGGIYKNRLIIPYRNLQNKIYNFQARSLIPDCPNKYIFRLGDHCNIYNKDFVNRDNPVFVLEGVIDSLALKDSIAISGAGRAFDDNLKPFKRKYFIMDADEKGREISIKLLELGEYVFMWNKFIEKYKLPSGEKKLDTNDVMIYLKRTEQFTFEELEEFFTNSIYHKIEFLK